jgi:hypothetical protein
LERQSIKPTATVTSDKNAQNALKQQADTFKQNLETRMYAGSFGFVITRRIKQVFSEIKRLYNIAIYNAKFIYDKPNINIKENCRI